MISYRIKTLIPSSKDYKAASGLILDALRFREKYMSMAGQSFCPTTSKFLARVDGADDPAPAPRVSAKCPYGPEVNSAPYAGDWKKGLAPNLKLVYAMKNGVLEMYDSEADKEQCRPSQSYFYPDTDEFVEDQAIVMAMMASGQCKTFCYQRLQFLDAKWRLHDLLNGSKVSKDVSSSLGTLIYVFRFRKRKLNKNVRIATFTTVARSTHTFMHLLV